MSPGPGAGIGGAPEVGFAGRWLWLYPATYALHAVEEVWAGGGYAHWVASYRGQELAAVERSIRVAQAAGITPLLAYYSPIPHTAMWPAAVSASRYDLAADPIFTNNSILPCQSEAFNWETVSALKELASGLDSE